MIMAKLYTKIKAALQLDVIKLRVASLTQLLIALSPILSAAQTGEDAVLKATVTRMLQQ